MEVYGKTSPICLLSWLWEFLLVRWCKRFHRTQCHLWEERKLVRGVKPNKQAEFARFPSRAGEQKDKQLRFCLQSPEFILLPKAQDHSPAFFTPSPLSCCLPHGGRNSFSIPWVCLISSWSSCSALISNWLCGGTGLLPCPRSAMTPVLRARVQHLGAGKAPTSPWPSPGPKKL